MEQFGFQSQIITSSLIRRAHHFLHSEIPWYHFPYNIS